MVSNNIAKRVCIVGPGFGTATSSLYWGKIFGSLSDKGLNVSIHSFLLQRQNDLPEKVGFRSVVNGSFVSYLKSAFLLRKYDCVIINEFSLLSFVTAVVLNVFGRKSRLILLVENHPRFLKGYGKDRETRLHRLYRSTMLRLFAKVITNNDESGQYIRNGLGARNDVVATPYLTSESTCIADSVMYSSEVKPPLKVVCIGQLIPRKGFLELIENISTNIASVRNRFKFDIVGSGFQREVLQSFIDQQGIGDVVRLIGAIPYEEVADRLRNSDIFLSPTLADYRSLVCFEALTAGRPLIVSKEDGSCSEVVSEGLNGFVYDPFASNALIDVLEIVWENRQRLNDFSAASVLKAERYTLESASSNLMKIINSVA